MTLFTHLKIILLQCFQFSAKISYIQTDPLSERESDSFFSSLSLDRSTSLSLYISLTHSNLTTHYIFGLYQVQITWFLKPFIFMHSCIFYLGFGVFENFWDFLEFCEIFGLDVFDLILYAHALHSHCNLTMFHAFRCVLDCWKMCAGRFRLGFYP